MLVCVTTFQDRISLVVFASLSNENLFPPLSAESRV